MALKGRLKQGVTRGCFGRNMQLEDMAREAARLGAKCFDLLPPQSWPVVQKYGLVPDMVAGGGSISEACNRKEYHAKLE